jgi:hypothetical protein
MSLRHLIIDDPLSSLAFPLTACEILDSRPLPGDVSLGLL